MTSAEPSRSACEGSGGRTHQDFLRRSPCPPPKSKGSRSFQISSGSGVELDKRSDGAPRKALGSFDRYVWGFADNVALSKDLKKRGFRFVGPTVVESFMQAVGIRNDHDRGCYRYAELVARR